MSLDGYIAGPNEEVDWILVDPQIDFGALFKRFDTVLLGRKSYEAARSGVTVSDDPGATVRMLKASPGKDIWLFGGGSLFRSLLQIGLVDSVQVAVIPVLLGDGVPLLPTPAVRARLQLTRNTIFETTGTVLLDYDIV